MIKNRYILIASLFIHSIPFLHAAPIQLTPAILPPQTVQPVPIPNLFPGVQIHSNIKVSTPLTKTNIVTNFSHPVTVTSAIPMAINQNMQNQLKFATGQQIKQPPIRPHFPQDNKKLAPENNMSSVALAAVVAAGIAHFLNNTDPTPQRVKPKPNIPDKKHAPLPPPIKTGLEHIIDQQYSQLVKIATEYKQALHTNTLYHSGKSRARIQKRIDAIKQWQSNPNKKINRSQVNRSFSQYARFESSAYTSITADPVQRALHKEITNIARELANFQKLDPQISGYLFNHATLLMEISRSYTGSNIIVQAMNAADVCWEIIEAAHTAGPEVLFSKETQAIWQQYFVYSHAKMPECSVDWNQFEFEKTRWGIMQKQCERLVEGCTVFVQNSQSTIEKSVSTVGNSLSRIATTIDNFLLNEVAIKIDSFCRLLGRTTLNIAQQCKEKLVSIVQASKTMVIDFVQGLYNQIAELANSGIAFVTGIAMNAITLYLIVGLFSTGKNPIEFQAAAMLSVVMKLIHASGSASTLVGSVTQTLLYVLKTNPIQALIISAALLTPVISPLIEEYRDNQRLKNPVFA